MTPALDAMVKAMAAEFERQADEEGSTGIADKAQGVRPGLTRLDGIWDLEKVARAGLVAIKESGGPTISYSDLVAADDCFAAMVDVILADAT
jgi:hypothetical protein